MKEKFSRFTAWKNRRKISNKFPCAFSENSRENEKQSERRAVGENLKISHGIGGEKHVEWISVYKKLWSEADQVEDWVAFIVLFAIKVNGIVDVISQQYSAYEAK